jgi:hypothetical protein
VRVQAQVDGDTQGEEMSELEQFIAARDWALVTLDESYVAKTVPAAPPSIRLTILHKARYECINIDPQLRHESRAWLAERGLSRMTGTPLLPAGELPE